MEKTSESPVLAPPTLPPNICNQIETETEQEYQCNL